MRYAHTVNMKCFECGDLRHKRLAPDLYKTDFHYDAGPNIARTAPVDVITSEPGQNKYWRCSHSGAGWGQKQGGRWA